METLDFSDANTWITLLTQVGMAIVIFVVGWIVGGMVKGLVTNMMRKRSGDEAVARFLGDMARYLVLAFAVITSLAKLGVDTTSLAAVLGAAGFAVGLALQGNLGNFAAGVMILVFKPFRIGEVINAAGHTGKVVDIGIFATTMHTPENHKIIISNGAVTGGSIVNYTTLGTRRLTVEVGVDYGSKLEEVIPVLKKAAERAELVLDEPEVAVAFTNLGASSLDFAVHAWAKSADYLAALHQVRSNVYDDLNAAGIGIPYQTIVVQQEEAG